MHNITKLQDGIYMIIMFTGFFHVKIINSKNKMKDNDCIKSIDLKSYTEKQFCNWMKFWNVKVTQLDYLPWAVLSSNRNVLIEESNT